MFSLVIYAGITKNIENSFMRAESRIMTSPNASKQLLKSAQKELISLDSTSSSSVHEAIHELFLEELRKSKQEVFFNLLIANLIILIISTIISYILAGKTLAPLEESMLEQKRFVADASHELRTPLTSLKTAIEVSLRDKKLPKKARSILEDNLEDVEDLNELIDRLLQLASSEQRTLVKQLIDIREVISRAYKRIEPQLKEKKIKYSEKITHQQILASEEELTELFVILLDNAVKYSTSGGKISIEMKTGKRFIEVFVKDSGVGIQKKYLPHIFDRFYRIDSCRTKSQSSGFGLGLSLAKQIIESHGGQISADSELGSGTTFRIQLPL